MSSWKHVLFSYLRPLVFQIFCILFFLDYGPQALDLYPGLSALQGLSSKEGYFKFPLCINLFPARKTS